MSGGFADEVAIVGWAQTEHCRRAEDTPMGLINRVVLDSLASCNMSIREIEVIVDAGSDFLDGTATSAGLAVDACGAHFKSLIRVAGDGLVAAVYALLRIASGVADSAIVVSYGKSSESDIAEQARACAEPFFTRPTGIDAVSAAALQESAYLGRYGISRDACADVVVKNRASGENNPFAQLRSSVTRDEALSSPDWTHPIRKLEVSPASDGACALVMVEGGVAEKLCVEPAWVTGVGHSMDSHYIGARDLHRAQAAANAAAMAKEMAGVSDAAEIDAFEMCEFFAFQELMFYEAMGLCSEGEGPDFLSEQVRSGGLLLNPSGGALCANPLPATGLVRLADAAALVTGRTASQSGRAKRAMAIGNNGLAMQSSACMILESS